MHFCYRVTLHGVRITWFRIFGFQYQTAWHATSAPPRGAQHLGNVQTRPLRHTAHVADIMWQYSCQRHARPCADTTPTYFFPTPIWQNTILHRPTFTPRSLTMPQHFFPRCTTWWGPRQDKRHQNRFWYCEVKMHFRLRGYTASSARHVVLTFSHPI